MSNNALRSLRRPFLAAGQRHRALRASSCLPVALALALSGCAIPRSGPSTDEIVSQSAPQAASPFALVDVDSDVLAFNAARPRESLVARFGPGPRSSDLRIAVGDIVTVNIWEAPPGSLFGGNISIAGVQQSSGSSTAIPPQIVAGDRTISVPYAGRVAAAGRTPSEVERQIKASLAGKAVQPQVLVTVQRSTANAVTVTGEVAGGARIPLTGAGERVLDAIASAGGLRDGASESVIGLTRGAATGHVPFYVMIDDPRENIRLRPGDVITVVHQPQNFMVLGAAGRNAEIPFEASRISMADALAKAGGLNDFRADVGGVFLLRYEMASVARRFLPPNHPVLASGASHVPVVYRFDLRKTSTMLAMQRFQVQPRDVIYIANAPGADLQKVMAIFQGVASPAITATSIGIGAAALH